MRKNKDRDMRPQLVPLPSPSEDFNPTEEEKRLAFCLQQEFLANQGQLDELFERQGEILLTLQRNPRLLHTLQYDSIWDFLNDPDVQSGMRLKIGSRAQLYRLIALVEVHERFPALHILREPHLSKLTHTGVLSRLRQLAAGDEAQAAAIVDETRTTTLEKLNALPHPEVTTKAKVVLLDGEPVLQVEEWSALTIRSISRLAHFSPPPSFEFREAKVIAWHNGRAEFIGTLLTNDERVIEYLRNRLSAKQC